MPGSKLLLLALIVEDHEPLCRVLVNYLQSSTERSWEAHAAGSEKEARDLLESNKYDFIILDEFLPDGLGSSLFDCIAEHCPKAKVVSTSESSEAVNYTVADAVLHKPFSATDLKNVIDLLFPREVN